MLQKKSGAEFIELHTGKYGEVSDKKRKDYDQHECDKEIMKLIDAAEYANSLGLKVNAGHGLTYENVPEIAKHPTLFEELNIGHNIVSRAMFVGLEQAVKEMKELLP